VDRLLVRRNRNPEEKRSIIELPTTITGDPLLGFFAAEELGQLGGCLDPGVRKS
jgi:hypothetical protein